MYVRRRPASGKGVLKRAGGKSVRQPRAISPGKITQEDTPAQLLLEAPVVLQKIFWPHLVAAKSMPLFQYLVWIEIFCNTTRCPLLWLCYPEAFVASVKEKVLPPDCKLRRVKYLNNVIEQDHRAIRRRWRAMRRFRSFHTAERALEGVEALHMIRKGQVKRLDGRDVVGQAQFVASLFGMAA